MYNSFSIVNFRNIESFLQWMSFFSLFAVNAGICPPNSITYNGTSGKCYWDITASTMNAYDCSSLCCEKDGVIAEIEDESQCTFVSENFLGLIPDPYYIWIGVNDINEENSFVMSFWNSGTQSYFMWSSGQPNGAPLSPDDQDCVVMVRNSARNQIIHWQDRMCEDQYYCLCSSFNSTSYKPCENSTSSTIETTDTPTTETPDTSTAQEITTSTHVTQKFSAKPYFVLIDKCGVIHNGSPSTVTETLIQCSRICAGTVDCESFSYTPSTSECYLHMVKGCQQAASYHIVSYAKENMTVTLYG